MRPKRLAPISIVGARAMWSCGTTAPQCIGAGLGRRLNRGSWSEPQSPPARRTNSTSFGRTHLSEFSISLGRNKVAFTHISDLCSRHRAPDFAGPYGCGIRRASHRRREPGRRPQRSFSNAEAEGLLRKASQDIDPACEGAHFGAFAQRSLRLSSRQPIFAL